MLRDKVSVLVTPPEAPFTLIVVCVGGGVLLPLPDPDTRTRPKSRHITPHNGLRCVLATIIKIAKEANAAQARVAIRVTVVKVVGSASKAFFSEPVTVTVNA
jgi:hypothetical protein